MFYRPIILCLLNFITETIQVTEGCMLASPDIKKHNQQDWKNLLDKDRYPQFALSTPTEGMRFRTPE